MRNPFRYFNSSPEVIRLAVMMYIRFLSFLKTPYSAEPHPGRAIEAPAKGEIEGQWACVCRAEALFSPNGASSLKILHTIGPYRPSGRWLL